MRKLKDASGATLPAPEGFRYYRDELPSNEAAINAQRKRFEHVFRDAARAPRIKRVEPLPRLGLHGRQRREHRRAAAPHARRRVRPARRHEPRRRDGRRAPAPAFTVDTVTNDPGAPEIARRVDRHVQGPVLPDQRLRAAGGRFDARTRTGNPSPDTARYTANFDCIIPHAAVDDPGAEPGAPVALRARPARARPARSTSAPQRTSPRRTTSSSAPPTRSGSPSGDVPNTIGILADLGNFPELTDRLQQGLLNELYLGRLMVNPSGFLSDAAFHVDGATPAAPPVIDTSKLYYNGNSQGGILGGALTAVAPDFTRASLGVPAMSYSILLTRSVDFDIYAADPRPGVPERARRGRWRSR